MFNKILYYKNIFATLIVVGIFFFVGKDMLARHSLAMKKLEAQKEELAKIKDLIGKYQGLVAEAARLKLSFFSGEPNIFKTFVEGRAQEAGITVNSLTPSKKGKDFYWESNISIRGFSPGYANIIKFIKALEAKNITTDSLRIRSDAQKKRTLEVTLKAFGISEAGDEK